MRPLMQTRLKYMARAAFERHEHKYPLGQNAHDQDYSLFRFCIHGIGMGVSPRTFAPIAS